MRPSRFRLPRGEAWRENFYGYLFISPWILGFVIFLVGPLAVSLGLMFTEYAGFKKITFVGLANFQELIQHDIRFTGSLSVSAVFAFWTVSLAIIISLGMALLLNQRFKGHTFFRGLFYLPAAVSGVAMTFVWAAMFEKDYGMFNQILRIFRFRPDRLADNSMDVGSALLHLHAVIRRGALYGDHACRPAEHTR